MKHFLNKTVLLILLFVQLASRLLFGGEQPILDDVKRNVENFLHEPIEIINQVRGGLTNSSFAIKTKADKLIARFGKTNPEILGINRFCEVACQKSASAAGVAPEVLYSDPEQGILISNFIEAETLTGEKICTQEYLVKVIQLIKKYHRIPFRQEFASESIYQKVLAMLSFSANYQDSLFSADSAQQIKEIIIHIERHFQQNGQGYDGLCHCDLFPPNFMDDGKQLWLVDWEYACWGNILYDLANLCTEFSLDQEKIEFVLHAYFGTTWSQHYENFLYMFALFNLRNALWYDLRGKEIAMIDGYSMKDYAQKHLDLFYKTISETQMGHLLKIDKKS